VSQSLSARRIASGRLGLRWQMCSSVPDLRLKLTSKTMRVETNLGETIDSRIDLRLIHLHGGPGYNLCSPNGFDPLACSPSARGSLLVSRNVIHAKAMNCDLVSHALLLLTSGTPNRY